MLCGAPLKVTGTLNSCPFNTPLEMPVVRGASCPQRTAVRLSILHWRCGVARLVGQQQARQAELSILHWRCGTELTNTGCCRGTTGFQYSIGDAIIVDAVYADVALTNLSILHWRCNTLARHGLLYGGFKLSILHWRCWGFLSLFFAAF